MSARDDELVPVWTTDGHADEGTIHTWLDGAFDSASSAAVGAHVDSCSHCREVVAEARGLIAGASRMVRNLDVVPAGVVGHEDVVRTASRIIAAADATRVSAVQLINRPTRKWYAQPAMRSAAAIALMIAGGSYVWSRTPADERDVAPSAATPVLAPEATSRQSADEDRKEQPAASVAAASPPAARAYVRRSDAPVADAGVQAKSAEVAELKAERVAVSTPIPVVSSAVPPVSALATQAAPTPAPAPPSAPVVTLPKVAASTTTATDMSRTARSAGTTLEARANSRDSSLADMKRQANMQQFAGAMAAARRRPEDEPVPSQCWTMTGDSSATLLRLPSELHLPDIDGVRNYSTRWIGWPEATTALAVRMRVDNDGRLVGESVSDEQHVRLIMQRVVGGWQGTATHTIDGKRTTQRVQLKSVPDLMCNP